MSETIKITVIIKDGQKAPKKVNVTHDTDMTLMSTLIKERLISVDNCGGRGVCGRCRIRFINNAPIPTGIERNAFSPEELRQGCRLACMAKPRNDCLIETEFIENRNIDILTAVPEFNNSEEVEKPKEIDDITQMSASVDQISQHKHIIAVDLGTTTIAMQLMELETGKIIDTYCAMNPQRVYGADVLSRIQAAGTGHADSMKESVWKVISDGVTRFAGIKYQNQPVEIGCMCIAGNTTMEHLLMGLSTEGLGKSPFTPVELGLQKCIMSGHNFPVYITPGITAFVGGDIAAGLYHCNLLPPLASEMAEHPKETEAQLFIDLGTNGEMAIIAGERIIVTATAAGPAFEGGAGAAVPGSDMIKITASLLEQGSLDETGLLAAPYFDEGIDVTVPSASDHIHLTQSDIRTLQMAKAAIRAGIEILCKKIGNLSLTRVYLAGGFGYYLDVNAAITIGLIPENLRNCTYPAGNTSLAGAFDIGRDLLTGLVDETVLIKSLQKIESINLAQEEDFERLYINYLNFTNNPDI